MSPKRRISRAITRPDSSRKIRSSATRSTGGTNRSWSEVFRVGLERTHLDRAFAGDRSLLRPFEGRIEIGGADHPEAAEVFLGLGERPVGHHHVAAFRADDG